jgi:hypothetical protein
MLLATSKTSLTTIKQHEWLADVIHSRDKNNNGIARNEAIQVLEGLADANNIKGKEHHLDYLIWMKLLPKLKNDGRIIRAQNTTTK